MADGLGRTTGGPSNFDPSNPSTPSPLSSPRSEQTNSSSLRIPDLVRDSKLETYFSPDSSVETVHTYHEPDYKSRRRLVSRSEHWRRYGKIGGGSFGSVWLEKCTEGARRGNGLRAIKQMEVRRQSTQVDYNRELEAIAKFSHWKYERAFVKSFGWYESPDHLFIAMEYLELGDLHTYLHHKPPLPEHEAKEITFQILDGLFLMHDNEFAHRDLKPRNILLKSCPPDEWWVKIADFGISKRIEDEIGLSSTLKGTLGYIAPELHGFIKRGTPYAPDLWAVGEIAFQMITKQPTFKNLGVLFKYMSNVEMFPSDLLVAACVGQNGQACILSLMHPDPLLRTTAEEALQHAWFNETVPSRHGSVKSARNIHPPPPVTDTGTEELATWNTITTQESEGASNRVDDTQVGTWSTNVSSGTHVSPVSRQVADLQVQTSNLSLTGDAGPVVDTGTDKPATRNTIARPHSASAHLERDRVRTNVPSTYNKRLVDEEQRHPDYIGHPENTPFHPADGPPLPYDKDPEYITARRAAAAGTAGSSTLADAAPAFHYFHENRGPVTDTVLGQVGEPTPWNHEPHTVVSIQPRHRNPSLYVHHDDDESETFITQRMREIWESMPQDDRRPESSDARHPYNRTGIPAPWASGITSTNERPDWPLQENANKSPPDGKSRMSRTFKDFVNKWRSKEYPTVNVSDYHSSPPVPDKTPVESPPLYVDRVHSGRTIFGVPLIELLSRDSVAVPGVVAQCITAIEKYGIGVEGIYSQSEKPDVVDRMMRDCELRWPSHDLTIPANFYNNIKNAASLLKRFLRLLPDPVLALEHYATLIAAARLDDDIVRRDSVHGIVNSLPDAHYAVLRALSLHLYKVQQHSRRNRMNISNLAIIFGPLLMGSGQLNPADVSGQVRVVQTIIENTYAIFDED